MIGLTDIDRLIGGEVGRLIWDILPDMHPGLARGEEDPDFPELWTFVPLHDEQGTLVDYPVIYMGSERLLGTTDRAFEYPNVDGRALPLSEYLDKLRLFLIYRLTCPPQGSLQLLLGAVHQVVQAHGYASAVEFIIKLWRGRWLSDFTEIGYLIRDLLAGGTQEGLEALLNDRPQAIDAATKLILREREAKEQAGSTDEWLFEAYCLLPEIFAWLSILRAMRERGDGDELSKYDRVLDEFLADISTTIGIPIMQRRGSLGGLAQTYALKPLEKTSSISDARREIRGLLRGRSIIPMVWYEEAMKALARLERQDLSAHSSSFTPEEIDNLDRADTALLFGCAFTKDGKRDHWAMTSELFDFYETEETPPGALSGVTISW